MVALGVDIGGQKQALGLWEGEGATENVETSEMLLADLETRKLRLTAKLLFRDLVNEGSSGFFYSLIQPTGERRA